MELSVIYYRTNERTKKIKKMPVKVIYRGCVSPNNYYLPTLII